MTASTMRRAAASIFVCIACLTSAGHALAQDGSEVSCATAQSDLVPPTPISEADLAAAYRAPNRLGSFQIVIVPGSGLSGNAAALAAFERAADQWEAFFSDPVTITINADLVNLGSPTVIGSTAPVLLTSSYTTIRNAMVTDASDESDDTIMASMPTSAQVSFTMQPGYPYGGNLTATKANLKALNFAGLDVSFGTSDGTINFNSVFAFDYDNSNGVSASTVDFESVAAHEIGHLLGFHSEIDYIDNLAHVAASDTINPSALDTIRFRLDASNPTSSAQFTTTARNMEYNRESVTDEIAVERRMSTGAWNGDGRQASHWKDDGLTGVYIGAMDPNIGYTEVHDIQTSDARALDLIGYDWITCGNGSIDPGEQCDDSNVANGDCCSSSCQYEANGSACTADSNQCTNDICNGSGTCTHPNLAPNTPCNDGLFCNGADQCLFGACSIHAGNTCGSGPECNNVCNEAADNCAVAAGTACSSDSNVCTNDVCNGSGTCGHTANAASCDDGLFCNGSDTCSGTTCSLHAGDPCSAGGTCQNVCNEAVDNCAATGTPCDDGLFCNGTDSCAAGSCTSHTGDPCAAGADCNDTCTEATDSCISPAATPCDDEGEVCTADTCDGSGTCVHTFDEMAAPECSGECPLTPQEGCLAPSKHTLQIADSAEAGKDKMSWKWQKGDEFDLLKLLGPGGSVASRFCIYSGTGPGASLLLGVKIGDSAAWTASGKGATYRDKDGTQDGVTQIKMKTGVDLKTSVQIKRKGTLSMPAAFDGTNLFDPSSTVVVQIGNSAGTCWSAAFAASAMKTNTPEAARITDETVVCGDGSRDRGEQCDGTDDAGCMSACDGSCTCVP